MIENPSNWFERLTGVRETTPDAVREQLVLSGDRIHSRANGQSWICGTLETPTLAELRERVRSLKIEAGSIRVREVVGDAQDLHADPCNQDALFQVASQFNLLEMINPNVTPEDGIGRYQFDPTQGPACAIAAGAGTIYRNYFVAVDGQVGQSREKQVDCLRDIARELDNDGNKHWAMRNGYALPTTSGLERVNLRIAAATEQELDHLRGLLRIGLQWRTQVTISGSEHLVSQAYCSAMPVSYSCQPQDIWKPLAKLILEAAYEATLSAGIINAKKNGAKQVFLTRLGGGAFGNAPEWIAGAIEFALDVHCNHNLDVAIVSLKPNFRNTASPPNNSE